MGKKFALGQLAMTPGIERIIHLNYGNSAYHEIFKLLSRHESGDWGTVCAEDAEANNYAVRNGERILSSYLFFEEKVWLITEADRSVTTLLLPEEY